MFPLSEYSFGLTPSLSNSFLIYLCSYILSVMSGSVPLIQSVCCLLSTYILSDNTMFISQTITFFCILVRTSSTTFKETSCGTFMDTNEGRLEISTLHPISSSLSLTICIRLSLKCTLNVLFPEGFTMD